MTARSRAHTLVALGEAALKSGGLTQARYYFGSALEVEPDLARALNGLGVVEAKTGNLQKAIELLERVRAKDPGNHAAVSNLGNLYKLAGQDQRAIESYQRALSLNPKDSAAQNNLGLMLMQSGKLEEASLAMRVAIRLDPNNPQAHFNLGSCLRLLMRRAEAAQQFQQAIELGVSSPEVFLELGWIQVDMGMNLEALQPLERAISLRPGYAEALNARGLALRKLGRLQEARSSLEEAIRFAPEHPEANDNLGVVLQGLGEFERALRFHRRALELRANFPDALNNAGAASQSMDRLSEARAFYEQALLVKPDFPGALSNLAGLYKESRCYKEALALYERAISLSTEDVFRYNCAIVQLHLQNYDRAWPLYEHRWTTEEFAGKKVLGQEGELGTKWTTTKPVWSPQVKGRRLLVWAEQGLGDEILFGSLLSLITPEFERVTALIDPRLIGLFSRAGQPIRFASRLNAPSSEEFDGHIAMGSVGQYAIRSPADLKRRRLPHLKPDPERVAQMAAWRDRIGARRLVGLSWRSSNRKIGKAKSLSLDTLLPLIRSPGITFVNLQYGDTAREIEDFCTRNGVKIHRVPNLDLNQDIEGAAALLATCDLLISSSNSNVHLAGAMGLPVWLLAPFGQGLLWYWSARDGRMSLWYPTVEIFDQIHDPDWVSSVAEMAKRLDEPEGRTFGVRVID
jgi:tetratricopeptide (TPR) repeat protein